MKITSRAFGETARGEAVTAYEISNASGSRAVILDYGATVQSLLVPDSTGALVDVALGYDTVAEYEANGGYLGATIGRVGNRIAKGSFSLGGREYTLARNDGENTLHGGIRGFDKYVWQAQALPDRLVFSRVSADGEEGFPGSLSVWVSFELTDANELRISYDADTDAPTPVSLTNHTYFNLNGGGDILTHRLTLNAEYFCEGAPDCLPTGRLASVAGTAFDFRRGQVLGEALAAGRADRPLRRLRPQHGALRQTCRRAVQPRDRHSHGRLHHPAGMQLYTANSLSERAGKRGTRMSSHGAVCLETQVFPDGMTTMPFPPRCSIRASICTQRRSTPSL